MSKLYDRADLRYNTAWWDRQEQQLYADVANGTFDKAVLAQPDLQKYWFAAFTTAKHVQPFITFPATSARPARHLRLAEAFELERSRERFKLLRTGELLQQLKYRESLCKACPNCTLAEIVHEDGRHEWQVDKPCDEHASAYKNAKQDVYWAGKRNLEERQSRGQYRPEDALAELTSGAALPAQLTKSVVAEENGLNKWEQLYQRDKAEGIWLMQDAKRYEVEFNYKGWLQARVEDEEMTEEEYLLECQRLREQASEAEETAQAFAGRNSLKLTARQRDTRFNRLAV